MSNLGSGSGSSYPGTLDTQSAVEVDSPNANKTKARAAVPNDLAAAIIAVETALGTTPQGTKSDVKTFLQTQHNADGTHGAITVTSINTFPVSATPAANTVPVRNAASPYAVPGAELAMTGEISATSASSPVTLDLGTVTSGDRIFIMGVMDWNTMPSMGIKNIKVSKSSGTATFTFAGDLTAIEAYITADGTTSFSGVGAGTGFPVSGILQVTGTGTLIMKASNDRGSGVWTYNAFKIYAFFLKKQ
jgi:hypothetical protein